MLESKAFAMRRQRKNGVAYRAGKSDTPLGIGVHELRFRFRLSARDFTLFRFRVTGFSSDPSQCAIMQKMHLSD